MYLTIYTILQKKLNLGGFNKEIAYGLDKGDLNGFFTMDSINTQ